ncbi:MAG: CPBP family glutamic-type intramembrane protease [Planctomycetota bacterium]
MAPSSHARDAFEPGHAGTFHTYLHESRRPLAMLVAVVPFVIAYEAAAIWVLEETSGRSGLVSRNLIHTLFELFGVIGVHLPAVLLVATLLAQHAIARERWRIVPWVPAGVWAEGAVWSLPLLVLAGVLGLLPAGSPADAMGPGGTPGVLESAAIAVGAGLYEEFVFRLVLLAAVHGLLVDICGAREPVGRWLAVLASAFAFASYHSLGEGASIDAGAAAFFGVAGIFLAWLVLTRGYAVAAVAHIVYDVAVLVLLPRASGG